MKQISISVPDRPGELAKVCDCLGRNGVNIVSIFSGGLKGSGIVHLITSDPRTAENALQRAGYGIDSADVILIKLSDKPGELAKITWKLAHARINVESILLLGRENGTATLALKVDKADEVQRALR